MPGIRNNPSFQPRDILEPQLLLQIRPHLNTPNPPRAIRQDLRLPRHVHQPPLQHVPRLPEKTRVQWLRTHKPPHLTLKFIPAIQHQHLRVIHFLMPLPRTHPNPTILPIKPSLPPSLHPPIRHHLLPNPNMQGIKRRLLHIFLHPHLPIPIQKHVLQLTQRRTRLRKIRKHSRRDRHLRIDPLTRNIHPPQRPKWLPYRPQLLCQKI